MSSYPEPTDVGPAAGGHLRVADADRDHVARLLTAARSEGRITDQEYADRSAVVAQAQVFDDLVPLTRDLVDVHAQQVSIMQSRTPYPAAQMVRVDPAGATRASETVVAIFSGNTRSGDMRLRRQTNAVSFFGGVELDLTQATWDDSEVVVANAAIFGGTDIFVPAGVNVVNEVIPIFGGVDLKGIVPSPHGPTLRLTGLACFGGIDVHGPDSKKWRKRFGG